MNKLYWFKLINTLRKDNPDGFTLTELLIAIALTGIVVAAAGFGLVAILRSNKTSESQTQRRIELNRALDFISDDVRQAKSVVPADIVNPNDGFRIVMPDNDTTIDYYFFDLENEPDSSIWLKPGLVRRIYTYQNVSNTTETLVDGIANNTILTAAEITVPECTSAAGQSTQVGGGGFVACINEDFRTTSLYLYGVTQDTGDAGDTADVILISSKFVTRNVIPPGVSCTIPDLSGQSFTGDSLSEIKNEIKRVIQGDGGFFGSIAIADNLTVNSSYTFTVQAQDPAGGTTIACGDTVTVSENACTLPASLTSETAAAATATINGLTGFNGTIALAGNSANSNWTVNDVLINGVSVASELPYATLCNVDVVLREEVCDIPYSIGTVSDFSSSPTTWNDGRGSLELYGETTLASTWEVYGLNYTSGQTYCSNTLQVSQGCEVPDFRTMSAYGAWATYSNSTVDAYFWNDSNAPNNTLDISNNGVYTMGTQDYIVESQSQDPGTTISCNSPISLLAEMCAVDNYFGGTLTSYSGSWSPSGSGVYELEGTSGNVTYQEPAAGSSIACSDNVLLSSERCVVPAFSTVDTADNPPAPWDNAGFTGSFTHDSSVSGEYTVVTQSLAANSVQQCTAPISVSTGKVNLTSVNVTAINQTASTASGGGNYTYAVNWDALTGYSSYNVYTCTNLNGTTCTPSSKANTLAVSGTSFTSVPITVDAFKASGDGSINDIAQCYAVVALDNAGVEQTSTKSDTVCALNNKCQVPTFSSSLKYGLLEEAVVNRGFSFQAGSTVPTKNNGSVDTNKQVTVTDLKTGGSSITQGGVQACGNTITVEFNY